MAVFMVIHSQTKATNQKDLTASNARDSFNFGAVLFQISTVSLPHYGSFLKDIRQQIMEFIWKFDIIYWFMVFVDQSLQPKLSQIRWRIFWYFNQKFTSLWLGQVERAIKWSFIIIFPPCRSNKGWAAMSVIR